MNKITITTPLHTHSIEEIEVNGRKFDIRGCKGFTIKWMPEEQPELEFTYFPPKPTKMKIKWDANDA